MSTAGRLLLLFSVAWATPLFCTEQGELWLTPHVDQSLRQQTAFEPQWAHREVSEAVSDPLPEPLGRTAAKGASLEPPARFRTSRAGGRIALSPPFDILLLIQRQNE